MEDSTILIVDDELRMRKLIKDFLSKEGCHTIEASNGEEAIEVFNKAIEIANNDAELYLNRGYCYFSLKNFRKAIKDFNKAIQLRPNFSEAYCRKAACYQEMKKEEEALIEYKHAIEINDLHSKPMLFQAALYVSNYYKHKNNYPHIFVQNLDHKHYNFFLRHLLFSSFYKLHFEYHEIRTYFLYYLGHFHR